jgi:hypothetical protein
MVGEFTYLMAAIKQRERKRSGGREWPGPRFTLQNMLPVTYFLQVVTSLNSSCS